MAGLSDLKHVKAKVTLLHANGGTEGCMGTILLMLNLSAR